MSLRTVIKCADCDWQPDPARRMHPDNQTEEHTKGAGHVTTTRMYPIDE